MPDDPRPRSAIASGEAHPGNGSAEGPRAAWANRAARAAGAFSALVGGTYLALWLGGMAPRWSAAGVLTMKANMALSLLVAGAGLLLIESSPSATLARRTAATIAGAFVLLVGVLTLGEHLSGRDLGIDQLLASEPPGAFATASPNRVGLPGAASLALLGAGLILAVWRRRFAVYPGLATCVVVVVPAIGFLYGVSPFYATRRTGIAWPTVVALLSLGIGLVLSYREGGPLAVLWRDDPGGALLRRLLLPSILIPLALGYVRVEGERHGLYSGPMGTGLYAVALILLLSLLLWRSAGQLSASAAMRERAAEQLAAEKERLTVTLRSIGDAVIATDESGRVTLVNGVAEALTGWKAEDALGRPLHEVFHILNEHSRQPVESPVERVLREGAVVGLANHTALVARDLTERPIADSAAPIRDADGHVSGVVLVFRDQTEERRAESALRSERERADWLASFPARNPVPIVEVDPDGGVRYANAAAERLLPDLRPLGTRHPWLAGWDEVVRAFREQGFPSHERIVAAGGAFYQQMMYFVPETGCIRIYGVDVTQRTRAEAALRESEQRLRALADSMPQLAWTAQPDGYITWYNHRWYEYTGTTPEQMEGWGWQVVHDPAALPEVLRRWTESIASGAEFEMEFPLRGGDGKFRRFLTRGFPLKDAGRQGAPVVRDEHGRDGARGGAGCAAGGEPSQGRVPRDALARAAQPARAHPQLRPHPGARRPRGRAGPPRPDRHQETDGAPDADRGRPPRRDPDRAREDRAASSAGRSPGARLARGGRRPAADERPGRRRSHDAPRRGGLGRRGPDAHRAAGRESAAQRRQVHATRGSRDALPARVRERGGDLGHRHRHRDRPGPPPPGLRPVRPGAQDPGPDRRRPRSRPRRGQGPRGAARRQRTRRERRSGSRGGLRRSPPPGATGRMRSRRARRLPVARDGAVASSSWTTTATRPSRSRRS